MDEVVWWEVETTDPELFQQFHAALSGWSFEPAFEDTELGADYWIIKAGDRGIGGLQRADPSAPPPSAGPRLYVAVDDLEAALDRVAALGGLVERSRVALGGADRWFGIFRDPTGVSFGMWTGHATRP
ncbi:VOC family protein [Arthrobacter sp. zg-Y411]|uniref:VOC family protein n=1 Tax=Arthrobacter zhangbolii TaxID=2886936 RepID=UPI001D159C25|nr:VOC family protein [Arthrobacter zhangbolii]MCC3294992.1 VOC family protein [Arthrobacter zhangbolii]